MSLFHVRLSVQDERSDELKTDLDDETLERQFLEPYRKGEPITVNGKTLGWDQIERIRISETDRPIRHLAAQISAEDRASSVVVIGGPSAVSRAVASARDLTDQLITGPPGHSAGEETATAVAPTLAGSTRRSVFLVSGRDNASASALKALLRALGLNVVEWEHAVAKTGLPNPYVGDVVAVGMDLADAIVVLLTPDDHVQLRQDLIRDDDGDSEREVQLQARPNVYYEAGIADALGRELTVIVEMGRVKSFSDAAGRHVVRYDGSAARRHALAERLRVAGLTVDTAGQDWLHAGNVEEVLINRDEEGDRFSPATRRVSKVKSAQVAAQIRSLLEDYTALREQSKHDDVSDLPDDSRELTFRMQSLMDKVGAGSTYAGEAAKAEDGAIHHRLRVLVAGLRGLLQELEFAEAGEGDDQ